VKPRGKEHLEDVGVVGRIISKPFLNKHNGSVWTEFIWHRTGTGPL